MIYEVFDGKFSRKLMKQEKSLKPGEESDAFDVDGDCKTLIYSCGDQLIFQQISIPEIILKYIKPRYSIAMHNFHQEN
jgi:hypothetical protein